MDPLWVLVRVDRTVGKHGKVEPWVDRPQHWTSLAAGPRQQIDGVAEQYGVALGVLHTHPQVFVRSPLP